MISACTGGVLITSPVLIVCSIIVQIRYGNMKLIKNFLLGNENNINNSSYLWNMLGGLLNAGQSVLILMMITRVTGIEDAGIFTIAYASANLFLTIGSYGMRNYQVTDVNNHFIFSDYLGSRILTSTVMILISTVFVLYGLYFKGYSINKAAIIFVICLLKVIDSIEDVFGGYYQQKGRLDVASKILTVRLVLIIISLCGFLMITKSLLLSSIITTIVCAFISFGFNLLIFRNFYTEKKLVFSVKKILRLLIDCIGPFLAAFLSFYVGNAPKYSIDTYLSQDIQAYYGFIAMPVFVIGLLNNFLYQPILASLAYDWTEHYFCKFIRRILKQILLILVITIAILMGAYFVGIPVLSLLYNTDLTPYKMELIILLIGGGMLAVVGFINIVLTIMRHQKDLIIGYMIIAIIAYFFSPAFVKSWGIAGASWLYTILMTILTIIFSIILIFRLKKDITISRQNKM